MVPVNCFDLTYHLSVFSVEELVREIEQYQGLRALRLEGNTVGVDAARAIAKALESKDLLQVVFCSVFTFTVTIPQSWFNSTI